MTPQFSLLIIALSMMSCSTSGAETSTLPFTVTKMAQFEEPWAMAFLPDGRAIITERQGRIKIWSADNAVIAVSGAPKVAYGGQGGLGDVVLHPGFATNRLIYLSWVEQIGAIKGAVAGQAQLIEDKAGARLEGLKIIWRQSPKVPGTGHFGHRLAFGPDGLLTISSGERQKFDPAQDPSVNLGKIIVMNDNGSNPHIVSMGHRNPLGLAFDGSGRLWEIEMGPRGGDELNLIKRGANYGWPVASNGSHYSGIDIPDHAAGDGFEAPKVWWNPSISPGSLMIYSGAMFAQWSGDAFIGTLGGESLIRVDLDGEKASKADEWPMDGRIREVEQSPDGAIWLLEDGESGHLLKLTPKAR